MIIAPPRRDHAVDRFYSVTALFRYFYWILTIAAVALPVAVLHAALSNEPDVSGRTFAGQLLIASPDMGDPFDHAVILMAQHNRDGALGIVINHPLARRPIANILTALGADSSGVTDSVQIFLGGPVGPNVAFVLHSADYHRPDTIDIDGRVALSAAAEVLRDIGLHQGPKRSLLAFGYAGWAPSQLDDEIARGAWVTAPEDPALVFDEDRGKVWTAALALYKSDH
ncbi:MAG TPA: YqgE/AlgH family protein [Xanthobacteraceae bacterium]|nr:YqgE/AlgH family protein [Xanthobacteraceae bacterium]